MKLLKPALQILFFQLQYFSNQSLFSRTYTGDNVELMMDFSNFILQMYDEPCDLQTTVVMDLKGWSEADYWNQEII